MAPQQRERSLHTGSASGREALPVEELDRECLSEREVRLRRAMVLLRERAVEHVAAHGSAPAGLHEALRAFAAELRSVRARRAEWPWVAPRPPRALGGAAIERLGREVSESIRGPLAIALADVPSPPSG